MENFKFDATTRTLVISAGFARALNDYSSDESKLYRKMLRDIPDLRVERKTHKKPTSYKGKDGKRTSYYPTKGLSYERMELFMNALPEGEKFLSEYRQLRAVLAVSPSAHSSVRRWFVAQFPKYREDPLFYVKNSVDVIDFTEYLETVKKSKEAV